MLQIPWAHTWPTQDDWFLVDNKRTLDCSNVQNVKMKYHQNTWCTNKCTLIHPWSTQPMRTWFRITKPTIIKLDALISAHRFIPEAQHQWQNDFISPNHHQVCYYKTNAAHRTLIHSIESNTQYIHILVHATKVPVPTNFICATGIIHIPREIWSWSTHTLLCALHLLHSCICHKMQAMLHGYLPPMCRRKTPWSWVIQRQPTRSNQHLESTTII